MRRKSRVKDGKVVENKKIKNARICVYDGITFKSTLEMSCYKHFLEAGIKLEYEPRTYVLVQKSRTNFECYEKNKDVRTIREMSYTPDFEYEGNILEIKGFCNETYPLKAKLFKQYLNDIKFTGRLFLLKNKSEILNAIKIIKYGV